MGKEKAAEADAKASTAKKSEKKAEKIASTAQKAEMKALAKRYKATKSVPAAEVVAMLLKLEKKKQTASTQLERSAAKWVSKAVATAAASIETAQAKTAKAKTALKSAKATKAATAAKAKTATEEAARANAAEEKAFLPGGHLSRQGT